ncbi:MAG TPA: indole-3-glycerol phosphate synthase TrpC [Bacteroidota bacterium]|nr:indole-3-glycerol phosphate synthase TrpC [Bacteroidota bacterium]
MNLLDQIVEHKREEISARKREIARSELLGMEFFKRTSLSLHESLVKAKIFGIIAEIKRASPSAGTMKSKITPGSVAEEYQQNGAAGISVLTDERYFNGTVQDLEEVRRAVSIPVLRKEFIIDEYQVIEAKAHGADAILLIAAILERSQLVELYSAAHETGLECLVELYDESEIDRIDFDKMKLVGINNRNLRTLEIDITRSISISRHLPEDTTVVSESGIQSADNLARLHDAGIRAALIGEHLMKSASPGKALAELLEQMESRISA